VSPHYIRPMPDFGPGWVHHQPPPGPDREPVVVHCGMPGCSSALAMPPGTPLTVQTIRLEVAGWTCLPDGPYVCGDDHDQQPPVRVSWWRRWFGGGR
jgi:hypothetical protein